MALEVGFLITQASTGLLVVMGAFLMRARPRRRGTVAFGLSSAALGVAVLVQNFLLSEADQAVPAIDPLPGMVLVLAWLTAGTAMCVAVVSLPRPLPRAQRRLPWAAAPVAAFVFVLYVVLAVAIAVLAGDRVSGALWMGSTLGVGLTGAASVGAGALCALRYGRSAASERRERIHYALITAGLLPYWGVSAGVAVFEPRLYIVAVALVPALAAVSALWFFAGTRRDARLARDVALVAPLSVLAGMVITTLAGGFFALDRIGVFAVVRLLTFGLIAYAILRHQLFGLRLRARRLGAAPGLERERHELYRAALDGLGSTTDASAQRLLSSLRRTLGISLQDHRRLEEAVAGEALRGRIERRGRFRIIRELGRGGQGRALLARDLDLDRDVVLKEPFAPGGHAASRDRFLAEARAAARIVHPNVVTVHAILADDDPPLLVLEHVPGGDLQAAIEREGAFGPDAVAAIGRDLLCGLEQLHGAGLVHGDVKPGNVLLDADGRAKVADLGMAVRAGTAVAGGTPGFVAPEVCAGRPPDPRSDLWSVGATLHAALSGGPPAGRDTADAGSPQSVLRPHVGAAVPASLRAVIEKALHPDPARRHPDAASMRRELQAAVPGSREGAARRGSMAA